MKYQFGLRRRGGGIEMPLQDDEWEEYNKAIECSPYNAMLYAQRGLYLFHAGFRTDASADFEKALGLNPSLDIAYYGRALLGLANGAGPAALADLNEAIRLSPEVARFYQQRAKAFSKLWQYRLALNDLNKAIELDPEESRYYYDRGLLRLYGIEPGVLEPPRQDLEKSIQLCSKHNQSYYHLGLIFFSSMQFHSAIEAFEVVLSWKDMFFQDETALWLYLAYTFSDHQNRGRQRLQLRYPSIRNPHSWPMPIIRYFLDQLTSTDTLAEVSAPFFFSPECQDLVRLQAHFFIGARALAERRSSDALVHLRKAKELPMQYPERWFTDKALSTKFN
jgi:lipoprotein NlpI